MSVPIFKIIIFGESGAPKAELIKRFMTGLYFSSAQMTIGVDFEVKSLIVDQQKVKLQIWDFGGEERFRYVLPKYVRGVKGVLFVYDVANELTLMKIDDWLRVIRKETDKEYDIPIILVGIVPERAENRKVSPEEGMKIAKSKGINRFIECNVRTGENVENVFMTLTRLMMRLL